MPQTLRSFLDSKRRFLDWSLAIAFIGAIIVGRYLIHQGSENIFINIAIYCLVVFLLYLTICSIIIAIALCGFTYLYKENIRMSADFKYYIGYGFLFGVCWVFGLLLCYLSYY